MSIVTAARDIYGDRAVLCRVLTPCTPTRKVNREFFLLLEHLLQRVKEDPWHDIVLISDEEAAGVLGLKNPAEAGPFVRDFLSVMLTLGFHLTAGEGDPVRDFCLITEKGSRGAAHYLRLGPGVLETLREYDLRGLGREKIVLGDRVIILPFPGRVLWKRF